MEKLKLWLEVADLFFKVILAAIVFVLFGAEKEQTELLTKQQTSNLVVAEKIIALLFDEKNKCIAEDQSYMIDFLIDSNNQYNKVEIDKEKFYQASQARRNCSNGSIAQDSKSSASLNQSSLPILTTSQDVMKDREALEKKGVTVEQPINTVGKVDGYVAVGVFSNNSFRNFIVPSGKFQPDGTVNKGSIIDSRWSVYLRANTSNTEGGSNPILGVVKENACVKVLDSFPNLRGQTWAAVNLVDCPNR